MKFVKFDPTNTRFHCLFVQQIHFLSSTYTIYIILAICCFFLLTFSRLLVLNLTCKLAELSDVLFKVLA